MLAPLLNASDGSTVLLTECTIHPRELATSTLSAVPACSSRPKNRYGVYCAANGSRLPCIVSSGTVCTIKVKARPNWPYRPGFRPCTRYATFDHPLTFARCACCPCRARAPLLPAGRHHHAAAVQQAVTFWWPGRCCLHEVRDIWQDGLRTHTHHPHWQGALRQLCHVSHRWAHWGPAGACTCG